VNVKFDLHEVLEAAGAVVVACSKYFVQIVVEQSLVAELVAKPHDVDQTIVVVAVEYQEQKHWVAVHVLTLSLYVNVVDAFHLFPFDD
jgi:hypothetical protein